jgi:hypothetical protein
VLACSCANAIGKKEREQSKLYIYIYIYIYIPSIDEKVIGGDFCMFSCLKKYLKKLLLPSRSIMDFAMSVLNYQKLSWVCVFFHSVRS